jgi:hypothetical protein
MPLSRAEAALRPRTPWEAVDLGVHLAQRHAGLLLGSWALLTLPLFALLSLLLWRWPGLVLLLFWWLKPAFERLPLHILARALFGATPTLGQALRAWPGLLRGELAASLLARRFSLSRSFTLPLLQLENLRGAQRQARLAALGRRSGEARWLTLLGMHIEMLLWGGLLSLGYFLLPSQLVEPRDWLFLLLSPPEDWRWLEHLINAGYALVLVVWEPVYVACGFTLYLNRRTELEAWDIELVFRRLRQRLIGSAYALLLGCAIGLALLPGSSPWADEPAQSCPLPQQDPNGPDAPRLQQQKLNSEQSREAVQALLAAPPFRNRETLTRWRLGEPPKETGTGKDDASLKAFLDALSHWKPLGFIAQSLQALLWGALLAAVALLLWRYRDWLHLFAGRLGLPQKPRREAPAVMFALELTPESLPEDIAGEAERLWDEQPRAALGLLYRALLIRLLHDFRVPLRDSTTEGEVLHCVEALERPELNRYAQILTRQWQDLAYGHRAPATSLKRGLCDGWRRLFDGEVTA